MQLRIRGAPNEQGVAGGGVRVYGSHSGRASRVIPFSCFSGSDGRLRVLGMGTKSIDMGPLMV
ncbi:hypothetical protein BN12_4060007 [Nostocoides japonicum T1-X7]|uniref:Uncharacterized protein n=1 Tax=Nostocoides japonicum T1-X7 TaxID=1194083 RepID=A0A077M2G6_9MICO|nr:hypothetical protein BN12_4060007 [Tetrasphaera japonica T1-X7]